MADRLDEEIEKTRAAFHAASKVATEALRERDLLEARLAGLELAATLRPSSSDANDAENGKSANKGRQPGAISQRWRSILVSIGAQYPHGATEDEITEIARASGLENTRAKDARDRMSTYQSFGYVERLNGRWRVTDAAIDRFKSEVMIHDPLLDEDTAGSDMEPAVH